jgi:hypothetical protein
MEDRRIQASYLQIDKGIFANTITATGALIASGNFQSSGTGIFSALDLNNIDVLSLSGVDVNITSGNIALTNRPTVNGTGVLLSGDIPYVQTNSYFYVDATRTDSYIENGNILYPYKTLSSAYNAAKNIASFNNPTYITLLSPIVENLTIDKGYINLVGNNTNKNDPIRITGSLVFAATGIGSTITDNNFSIAGLGVTATSNNKCILFSGNNPQRLFIQDCWLIAKDNGTCLYSNNTNTTSRLQGDILKLSPEGVNTTAIDIVSGTSSISFAETSSSASVLAYVRNNSTLNISNSQIETTGAKAFQVENTARLTLLNSVLTNTANPSTGIFLDASSTAVVVGSAISVPANANSYAINGVANSYLFYKNLYFSIDANGGSTESKIGNNVNKNLINSYDPVVYSIGDQTISGVKTFATGIVAPNIVYNTGNQTISGIKIFEDDINISGDLILNGGLYINDIEELNLSGANIYADNLVYNTGAQNISGVDLTIKSGNVALTNNTINFSGNNINFENENNINLAYQFPAWTGIRRYPPLDLLSVATSTPTSGTINYFPFLIKKKIVNPVACIDMSAYSSNDPKIVIGIYSGHYGFENAKLITSGFINGNISNTGIYRTTLNGTFDQGPYIVASMLETGAGSTFRILSSHGLREHFGINTGSNILHGLSNTALTNIYGETGASVLPQNIGSGVWYGTVASVLSPLVFLEY